MSNYIRPQNKKQALQRIQETIEQIELSLASYNRDRYTDLSDLSSQMAGMAEALDNCGDSLVDIMKFQKEFEIEKDNLARYKEDYEELMKEKE